MPLALRTDVRGGNEPADRRRAVRMTVTALLVALLTLLSPALTRPAAAAPAPADFAGISDWAWPTSEQARQLGADGVRSFRASLAWDWVEHVQGRRQWGGADKLVADAAANGYELVLVVNGCAAWSCGTTRTAPQTDTQRAQFLDFVSEAVRRYGAGGSFWRERPAVSPIRVNWQVWNEVNVGMDWPNPTTAGYAALLVQTSGAIKAVDPGARVITAGLAELPAVASGAPLAAFLAGLEREPGFAAAADVVAVHGYAESPTGTARVLDTTRRVMAAAGDGRPVWITELGWGTGGAPHPFVVTPQGQADNLRAAYDLLVGCRGRWNLDRAIWFALKDVTTQQLGEADYWGMHTGLYDAAGVAKPALDAFREYTDGRDLPGGRGTSCPLAGGADPGAPSRTGAEPRVTIVKAPQVVGKSGSAQVDFVTNLGTAGRAECSLDGAAFAPCVTPYAIPRGAEGRHEVRIRAISTTGEVSAQPAAAAWTLDLTPPTTIFTKRPPRRSAKKAVNVRLGVKATRLGTGETETVGFQCKLNRGGWKPCGARYRAKAKKAGRQVLKVRAVDAAGNVDPRGATARFTVLKGAR